MAKKKKEQLPMPLAKLQAYTRYKPDIWEKFTAAYPEPSGERCRFDGIMAHEFWEKLGDKQLYDYEIMSLANWRLSKQIYEFNEEIAQAMIDTDVPNEIPCEALMNLPYNSLYIKVPPNCIHLRTKPISEGKAIDDYLDGFFVCYDYFGSMKKPRLFMTMLTNHSYTMMLDVPLLPGKTVADIVAHKSHIQITTLLLKFILYICSENADVIENPAQKSIYRPHTSTPKDRYQEVRKWDVGVKYAAAFRRYTSSSIGEGGGEADGSAGSTKRRPRPHVRRGHLHHYWVGPKDSDSRRLILKWTAPTLVAAGDDSDDLITTINQMK